MMTISINGAVFVDTSAFVGLLVEQDANHAVAVEAWERAVDTLAQVKVKNELVAAGWLDHVEAAQSTGFLEVIFPDPDTDRLARSILWRFAGVRLSYVDATTLAILQTRSEIGAVFALDEHLFLSGVTSLVQLR